MGLERERGGGDTRAFELNADQTSALFELYMTLIDNEMSDTKSVYSI